MALPPKIWRFLFRNPQPLPGGAGAAAGLKAWGGLWHNTGTAETAEMAKMAEMAEMAAGSRLSCYDLAALGPQTRVAGCCRKLRLQRRMKFKCIW